MVSQQSHLALEEHCDISHAENLHQQLKDHVVKAQALTVDASEVSRLTTPCVQLLLAALASQKKSGHQMSVTNPSEAFTEAFILMGLQNQLSELCDSGAKT